MSWSMRSASAILAVTWYWSSERRSSRARKFSWLAMTTTSFLGAASKGMGNTLVGGGICAGPAGPDVGEVYEDSTQRAGLGFLKAEGFDDLIAGDLPHLGEDSAQRAIL